MLIAAILLNMTASGLGRADDSLLMAAVSSHSMQQFAGCFLSAQKRQSRPLWIVPYEDGGGTISNDGAPGVVNPYRIRFTENSSGNEVEVFIARHDAAEEQPLLAAVRSCS